VLTRTLRRRAFVAAAFTAASVAAGGDARADSCTSPDLLETIPADSATGVPLNASLFARYQTNAEYVDEPVVMETALPDAEDGGAADQDAGGTPPPVPVPVTVTFNAAEGLLQATPVSPLSPGTSYVVHWPALRGIDTATLGSKEDLRFTAGTSDDTSPPTFAGITSVSWDVSRDVDSCTNDVEERYVFSLGLGAAADDGGRDALTLVVLQTSGPGVDADAPVPVLVQRIPPAGQGVTVTSTDLVGHVCFAAIVQDLTAKVSTSGAPVCVDTVAPPFFYSCAVGVGRRSGGAAWLTTAAAFAVLTARRARPRARGRRRREGGG
jgi:hypothetical protein